MSEENEKKKDFHCRANKCNGTSYSPVYLELPAGDRFRGPGGGRGQFLFFTCDTCSNPFTDIDKFTLDESERRRPPSVHDMLGPSPEFDQRDEKSMEVPESLKHLLKPKDLKSFGPNDLDPGPLNSEDLEKYRKKEINLMKIEECGDMEFLIES
jgi:hypothetical protein